MKIRFNIAKCLCVCHRVYAFCMCAVLALNLTQHRITQFSSIYSDYQDKTVAKSGDKHFYMLDDCECDQLPARNSHRILFSKCEALENGLIRLTNACVEWDRHPPPTKKGKKQGDEETGQLFEHITDDNRAGNSARVSYFHRLYYQQRFNEWMQIAVVYILLLNRWVRVASWVVNFPSIFIFVD